MSASASCGPFRRSVEEIIAYAKLANKGKTKDWPSNAEHHAASLPPTTASPIPSIADRSWLIAALCFALPPYVGDSELDIRHCILLSVVYGMMQVSEELCQDNLAKDLSEELKESKSLASQIVLDVDKIAMFLLAQYQIEVGHCVQPPQSLVWLQDWAKDILHSPTISQDSVAMTGSGEHTEWSVETELQKSPHLRRPGDSDKSLAVFARIVAHLLSVRRQGWLDHDIPEPESVADHSWSMAVLCLVLSDDRGVNIKDALLGCVVHDIAESLVGDITPRQNIPKAEKHRRESLTLEFLQAHLPDDSPLKSSWDEFETGQTYTAQVARDLDRVDLGIQAFIYESKVGRPLEEFFVSASKVKVCGDLIGEVKKTRKVGGSGRLDPQEELRLNNYYGN